MASQGPQGRSCTIFVGNIPYDATEDDLKEIFSKAGPVESLRLVYDRETRQPKGYAFCDFSDPDGAAKAMKEMHNVEINGRTLRIDLADRAGQSGKGCGKGGPLALPPIEAPRASGQPPGSLPPGSIPPRLPAGMLPPDKSGKDEQTPESIAAEVSAHTETAQIVSSMSKVQLQLCLAAMQKLAEEAPEASRAFLQENPQLTYALLHAQMLFGLDTEPVLPPSAEEVQKIKMQAAARPMSPMQPGFHGLPGFGQKPFMPLLGMLGSQGFGGFGLGGFPSLPLAPIPPRPPSAPGIVLGAAAKSSMPQPHHVPVPLTPGVQPMDMG